LGLIECRLHLHSFPRLLYRSTPHSNFIGVFEVKERGAWMQVKSINLVYLFCLRKMLIIRFGIIEPSWMCICMHIHSSLIIRFLFYFDLKKLIRIWTIYYWVPSSRKSKQKLQVEKEGDVFFFSFESILFTNAEVYLITIVIASSSSSSQQLTRFRYLDRLKCRFTHSRLSHLSVWRISSPKNPFSSIRPCKTGKFSLRPYQNDYRN